MKPLLIKGYEYVCVLKHRKNNKYCKWIIPFDVEGKIFEDCINYDYIEKEKNKSLGYDLVKCKSNYMIVGKNSQKNELKLSKFVIYGKYAHGYPADYINHCQDKPRETTLKTMKMNGLVDDIVIKKICKGRRI